MNRGVAGRDFRLSKDDRPGGAADAKFDERLRSVGVHAKQSLVFRVFDPVFRPHSGSRGHKLAVFRQGHASIRTVRFPSQLVRARGNLRSIQVDSVPQNKRAGRILLRPNG